MRYTLVMFMLHCSRYATQLRQLNEMGMVDFDRNIQALRRSGGDVNGALEWLFSQPQ